MRFSKVLLPLFLISGSLPRLLLLCIATLSGLLLSRFLWAEEAKDSKAAGKNASISYHKQILPVIQAKCQGCHQASIPSGKLVMTSYAAFLKGGASGPSFVKKTTGSQYTDGVSGG